MNNLSCPKGVTSPVEAMRRYMDSLPPCEELSAKEELRDPRLWRAVRAEFVATLLLVVIGCGSNQNWKSPPEENYKGVLPELRAGLAFGAASAALGHWAGPTSGAHMNPSVSIALFVARRLSAPRCAAYIIAQIFGGLAGAGALWGLASPPKGLGATEPPKEVGASRVFGFEFLSTLVIVLTALGVGDCGPFSIEAAPTDTEFCGSLCVGLAYTACHLFAFPYTGASFNPARSFGPALITNTWRLHWVYWVAPVLGGIIGGVTYDYTRTSPRHLQHPLNRRRPPTRDISALSANETELTLSSNDHGRL